MSTAQKKDPADDLIGSRTLGESLMQALSVCRHHADDHLPYIQVARAILNSQRQVLDGLRETKDSGEPQMTPCG